LAQWLGAKYVGRGLNPTIAVWGGDLMIGNPRELSHLRVRELWVRVIVSPIIAQMCLTTCQIRVQVDRDNDRTYESLIFIKKKIVIEIHNDLFICIHYKSFNPLFVFYFILHELQLITLFISL
jgi:hypothetical protein